MNKDLENVLTSLQKDHYRFCEGANDAVTYNKVFDLYGANMPSAVNKRDDPDGRGSQVFTMLMCQNLLLLKRITALEGKLNEF